MSAVRERAPSGRALARPRSRAEAGCYLLALVSLYAGIALVFVLDSTTPACTDASCGTYPPGIRWAGAAALWGFLALLVLAVRLTRGHHRDEAEPGERVSSRGWTVVWNYLVIGVAVPAAVRVLRAPRAPAGGVNRP